MIEITVHVLEEQVDALAARIAAIERQVERVARGQASQSGPGNHQFDSLDSERTAADVARMSHRNQRRRQVDAIIAANRLHDVGVSAAEAVDRLRARLATLERTVGVGPGA